MEPHERLFFALWPDEAEREALVQSTADAVRHCGGRPVPVAGLHLTLVFLGAVPVRQIAALGEVARRVAAGLAVSAPLVVTFDHLEHWARPRVLCAAGATPSSQVSALAGWLRKETGEGGFSPDARPLREHVTLARKVVHPTAARDMPGVAWKAARFALVASRPGVTGSVYSVVESYGLYGGHAS
jgi:2'-5' RNA ligase